MLRNALVINYRCHCVFAIEIGIINGAEEHFFNKTAGMQMMQYTKT